VEQTPTAPTLDALGRLYQHRYRTFLRVAEAITCDLELARDCVQEAFARAIRGRFDYRGDGTLDAWVWRAVVNASRNARRDRKPHLPLDELPAAATPNGHGGTAVRGVLAALPERQRLVVFLRYYADLDYRGIANALSIEVGTVSATLSQAHNALRALLEEVPQ
jgi:RNA polymerase sigma factor (sigma-70 family)